MWIKLAWREMRLVGSAMEYFSSCACPTAQKINSKQPSTLLKITIEHLLRVQPNCSMLCLLRYSLLLPAFLRTDFFNQVEAGVPAVLLNQLEVGLAM